MQRTIKSFVLRAGRVSNRQQQALDHWLNDYILHPKDHPCSLTELFGREADTIAEIGFGMGQSFLSMAQMHPEKNFLGIEVHRAGIGSLVADLHDHDVKNVRIAPFDAVELFEKHLFDDCLSGVQLFFPDPWPKKKHHKRRIIQTSFVKTLVKKIRVGGFLHCATDWQEYAEHILAVLSSEPNLKNQQKEGGYVVRPESRPLTKFEQRGHKLGHGVWDLIFTRTS
ncbi:MAG: tRNA (guanosine(46)-N7)-methyltransferase TrmB [Legionella sp.]